ncbi:MAG: hypothetical protein PHW58_04355 [Candidatus Methanofastidiosa archaeon]|nr:hypothetical protein [Candidatus Methanofastidiosa archaeon]
MKSTTVMLYLALAIIVALVGIGHLTAGGHNGLATEEEARARAEELGAPGYDRVMRGTLDVDGVPRDAWIFEAYYGDVVSIFMREWVIVLALDAETGEELPFECPM